MIGQGGTPRCPVVALFPRGFAAFLASIGRRRYREGQVQPGRTMLHSPGPAGSLPLPPEDASCSSARSQSQARPLRQLPARDQSKTCRSVTRWVVRGESMGLARPQAEAGPSPVSPRLVAPPQKHPAGPGPPCLLSLSKASRQCHPSSATVPWRSGLGTTLLARRRLRPHLTLFRWRAAQERFVRHETASRLSQITPSPGLRRWFLRDLITESAPRGPRRMPHPGHSRVRSP
jgi:hypothetical protein